MESPLKIQDDLDAAIRELQRSYREYQASLSRVIDFGDESIPSLVAALNHKQANPIAIAIGYLMHSEKADAAIPKLLDWLVVQAPLYPDVLDTLVKAGDRLRPFLKQRFTEYSARGDDEAVRNLFDLGSRLPENELPQIVSTAIELLNNNNPHIRGAAADALWRIGLPYALPASEHIRRIATTDNCEWVRKAATEAMERIGVR